MEHCDEQSGSRFVEINQVGERFVSYTFNYYFSIYVVINNIKYHLFTQCTQFRSKLQVNCLCAIPKS